MWDGFIPPPYSPATGFCTPPLSTQWGGERLRWGTIPRNKGTPREGASDAAGANKGGARPAWGRPRHQRTKGSYTLKGLEVGQAAVEEAVAMQGGGGSGGGGGAIVGRGGGGT